MGLFNSDFTGLFGGGNPSNAANGYFYDMAPDDPATAILAYHASNAGVPPPAPGSGSLNGLLGSLSGVHPAAPLPGPIMSGGIAGAQQAPKPGDVAAAGGSQLDAMLKTGLAARSATPSLGELLMKGGIRG